MPKCAFPGTVEIVDTEEKAVAACAYLMAQSALGFDTETRPSFKAGVSNRTALLQLASADRCFLFRGGVGHRGEERPQARGDSARQFGFQGAAAEQLGSGHSHESADRVCGDGCLGLSGDI